MTLIEPTVYFYLYLVGFILSLAALTYGFRATLIQERSKKPRCSPCCHLKTYCPVIVALGYDSHAPFWFMNRNMVAVRLLLRPI
jgi:hypothetical protein